MLQIYLKLRKCRPISKPEILFDSHDIYVAVRQQIVKWIRTQPNLNWKKVMITKLLFLQHHLHLKIIILWLCSVCVAPNNPKQDCFNEVLALRYLIGSNIYWSLVKRIEKQIISHRSHYCLLLSHPKMKSICFYCCWYLASHEIFNKQS